MSGRFISPSDQFASPGHVVSADPSTLRLMVIGRPGLDGDCLCYVLRTCGVTVEFMDVAQAPQLNTADTAIALVQVEEGTLWRDWVAYIRENRPDLKLGVLVLPSDSELESELIGLGIHCFLIGSVSADIAVAGLQLARVGGVFIPPEILQRANRLYARREQEPAHVEAPPGFDLRVCFTGREHQIIELLRRGLQNKIIAHHLSISESTVKVHLRNVMKKLHATNRTQVAFLVKDKDKTAD